MFTIRKATTADCALIQKLAQQIFPVTYKDILTPEQTDYMMEWMYSLDNIRKQMEEEGHVYFLAYEECEAAGYVSVQQQGEDLFHLQKIYVLPYYQGAHCGSFLFREAIKYIKEVHPGPCLMELNVNRNNKALQFYEHMGMRKLREGDFPIGNGYYMNDYIMGLEFCVPALSALQNLKAAQFITNIAQPLVLSFVSDYFATFSSHFSMNSMVNMEMQHATTNTVHVIQIGILS